jgi:hypothetical protein
LATLDFYRSSFQGNEIAADAAKNSADAVLAAERARFFVVIENHNLEIILLAAEKGQIAAMRGTPPRVKYCFRNYGKTPGVIQEISRSIFIGPAPPPDPLIFVLSEDTPIEEMVAAGDKTNAWDCLMNDPITMQQATSILSGQTHFWFYGRLYYRDVFGGRQVHKFLRRYTRLRGNWRFQSYDFEQYNEST